MIANQSQDSYDMSKGIFKMSFWDSFKKGFDNLEKKTSDLIYKAEKRIKSYRDFQKNLMSFRNSLKSLELALTIFRDPIGDKPSNLESFYNELIKYYPNKYGIEKKRYIELISKIPEHDDNIKKVNSILKTFSYKKIIDNPLKYSASSFNQYEEAVTILQKYQLLADKYDDFLDQFDEIKTNFDFIKKQYNSVHLFKEIISIDGDYYLDDGIRQDLFFKLQPIVNLIKETGKKYYEFSNIDNIQDIIDKHNKNYIQSHINDTIFDSINGKSLDIEQRTSILTNEKASLTIAGAGSGKTLTICGKVKYLLEHEKIDPKDILLLSYSKKSADDLNEKVSMIDKDLTVGTFHKLGLDILKEANHQIFTVEEQYSAIIEQYFREELKNRPQIMEKVLRYFALYLTPNKKNKKYTGKGDLYEDLKKTDYRTLKTLLLELSNNSDKKETIKKELMKSFEEMAIANFYFINGIDYIYEAPYCVNVSTNEKRQYTPDFYLKKYKIYHEHYGIGKDGIPHQFEGEEAQKYIDGMFWKRDIHSKNKTAYIETYSYEFDDGSIFTKLERRLKNLGVEFNKLTSDEILKALNSIYEGQNFKSFITLIKSFLSLYKAKYADSSHFSELRDTTFSNAYEKKRANLFLDISEDIYNYYINYLINEDKIDFDDMILKSINALDNIESFKYKFIIVDEFQDISYSRMLFLKKLIIKGASHLFAVGDDWQAIYRFSGCDLDIFLNFEKYFGYSARNYITTTHRNSQELQDIAGQFIKSNPEQYDKVIKSNKHLNKPVKVAFYQKDKYRALVQIFREIYKINKNARILILGRNNHDIDDYLNTEFYFGKKSKEDNLKSLIFDKCLSFTISYSTVHTSKGLEEEFAIILNADDSRLGFPNKVEDDELLNLVLSSKSNFEYAEERRLWYVALTRTKTYTYIIADKDNPSIFLNEIIDSCEVLKSCESFKGSTNIACPHCKSGHLIMRTNEKDGNKFYGCSNYPYCTYTINDFRAVERNKRCPRCGDFMVYRKGRNRSFYGCHSYPKCKHSEDYAKQQQNKEKL